MEPIITLEDVSMCFRMDVNHTTNLKEWFVRWVKRQHQYETFYALKHINLTVNRGEVMGLVGRNGSGKSTLLKIVSGIYKPTSGKAVSAGRVAPMLELGSGFDQELTGRQNIFLNGAIMGFTEKYLQEKYDEIVAFAELGDFIDMPLKTYSSGMMMRLAFSVATIIVPEILIVDEILAVGDSAFQKKSFERMKQLMSGGTTVLLVSHSLETIRDMCDRVTWINHGEIVETGPTQEICDHYEASMAEG